MFRLVPMPTITKQVLSDGSRTYLLREQIDLSGLDRQHNGPPPVKHHLVPLIGGKEGDPLEIPAYEHASGRDGRLLFVNPGSYRMFDGRQWHEEAAATIGDDPVSLLAPDGVYVLSLPPQGPRLERFTDGRMTELPLPAEYLNWYRNEQCHCSCARLLWHQGALSLFWKETGTLNWAIFSGTEWSPAASWSFSGGYDVVAGEETLYLFQREGDGPEQRLTETVYRDGSWSAPQPITLSGEFFDWDVFLQQGRPHLFTQRFASATVATVENGALTESTRLKGPFDFARMLGGWLFFWGAAANLLPILVIFAISAIMVRFKKRHWRQEEQIYEFATLGRRATAFLIDNLLLLIPPGIIVALTFRSLDDAADNPFAFFLPMLGAFFLFFAGGFLYHALLEGLCGQTLGKRLCGIRVMKNDFTPCGLGAGFLRNLLRIADAFFGYLVGVVAMAASVKWQRIGDEAAETVVVRVAPPRKTP